MVKAEVEVKELRLRFLPVAIHKKIEKYIAMQRSKHDREITKEIASAELLDKATKSIKIPE